ncbi:MAG: rhomboid family intramembrane serine protease [Cyanobacteria bacterium P01_G01_bin.38]
MRYSPVLIYVITGVVFLSLAASIDWQTQAGILRDCVLLVWGISLVNLLYLGGGLNRLLAIRPRHIWGLLGIPFAPFLHTGMGHLIANTLPFLILGWFVMLHAAESFLPISALIVVIGGLGTWLMGRDCNHIGASGVVFGYLGYLVAMGYIEATVLAIMITLMVILIYGNQFLSMLPSQENATISWEGHLFGFLGGVVAAYDPDLAEQLWVWLQQLA